MLGQRTSWSRRVLPGVVILLVAGGMWWWSQQRETQRQERVKSFVLKLYEHSRSGKSLQLGATNPLLATQISERLDLLVKENSTVNSEDIFIDVQEVDQSDTKRIATHKARITINRTYQLGLWIDAPADTGPLAVVGWWQP